MYLITPTTVKNCCKMNAKLVQFAYHIDNVDMPQLNPHFSSLVLFLLAIFLIIF